MKVHIVAHCWSDDEKDSYEVIRAYTDINKAIKDMHELAEAEKQKVHNVFGKEFDTDLCEDCDVLVQFGWCAQALRCDCIWRWIVETVEVQ